MPTLSHAHDPLMVGRHLGRPALFVTRESDYLFDDDSAEIAAAIAAVEAGVPPVAYEQARVGAMVQAWIDGVCSGGTPYFRDIFSARGYVGDPNPAYHARAVLLRDWSSSVWTYLDGVAADVMSGQRLPPTDTELMAELPQPPEGAV